MPFYCKAHIGSAMFVPQIDRMLKQHLTFIKRTGRPLKTPFLPTPAPVFSQISCAHLPNWRRTATQDGRWFLFWEKIGNKTSSYFFTLQFAQNTQERCNTVWICLETWLDLTQINQLTRSLTLDPNLAAVPSEYKRGCPVDLLSWCVFSFRLF